MAPDMPHTADLRVRTKYALLFMLKGNYQFHTSDLLFKYHDVFFKSEYSASSLRPTYVFKLFILFI